MVNYNNGKIYKIVPKCEHESNEIYIGSTTKKYLSCRLSEHRCEYRQWKNNNRKGFVTSFELFEKYGENNCDIVLLEPVNANTKEELHRKEREYIDLLPSINKFIPLRTKKEFNNIYNQKNKESIAEKKKIYYDENKDILLSNGKIYREQKKEHITERKKEYYEANKEKILQYNKEYREKNKEKISLQRKESYAAGKK